MCRGSYSFIFTTALGETCNKNSPECTVANSKCVPDINNDYKCVCDNGFKKVGTACAAKGMYPQTTRADPWGARGRDPSGKSQVAIGPYDILV